MGSKTIIVSLPFSCALGLLGSMTSSIMGRLAILITSLFLVYCLYFYYLRCSGDDLFIWKGCYCILCSIVLFNYLSDSNLQYFSVVNRRFVWIYAAIQFALVVVFAHIFYSLVRSWSNILTA